jgi:hypothetical protein
MDLELELLTLALQNKLEILIGDYCNNHSYYSISINNYFNKLKIKYQNIPNVINCIHRLELGNTISDIDQFIIYLQIHEIKNIDFMNDLLKIFDLNYDFKEEIEKYKNTETN